MSEIAFPDSLYTNTRILSSRAIQIVSQWLLLYTTPRVGSEDRSFRVICRSLLRIDRPCLVGDTHRIRIPAAYVYVVCLLTKLVSLIS
jgi:hypothetical protein